MLRGKALFHFRQRPGAGASWRIFHGAAMAMCGVAVPVETSSCSDCAMIRAYAVHSLRFRLRMLIPPGQRMAIYYTSPRHRADSPSSGRWIASAMYRDMMFLKPVNTNSGTMPRSSVIWSICVTNTRAARVFMMRLPRLCRCTGSMSAASNAGLTAAGKRRMSFPRSRRACRSS